MKRFDSKDCLGHNHSMLHHPFHPVIGWRSAYWLPCFVLLTFLLFKARLGAAPIEEVVREGRLAQGTFQGPAWDVAEEGLSASGTQRQLWAKSHLGEGDFHLTIRLKLDRLQHTAASLTMGNSQFGLDGAGQKFFLEGPLFGSRTTSLEEAGGFIQDNRFFQLEVIRHGALTRFLIDGQEVHRLKDWTAGVGPIGLRPWRSRMTVASFSIQGNLVQPEPPARPLGEPVFVAGEGGYHTYRIPCLASTRQGTLLAFCEGRRAGRGDSGDIDLVLRRSLDQGQTWQPLQVVWDDDENTCGNPVLVQDQKSGLLSLLMTWNLGSDHERDILAGKSKDTRRVFVSHSNDEGASWTRPREITSTTKRPEWTWYATGPGGGIQIQRGSHRGRLVVACDFNEPDGRRFSHVILSDDGGETWRLGGITPSDQVNECEVVELADGRLLLNMRNYDRSVPARQIAFSSDGGESWHDQRHDPQLVEPVCQGSVERHSWPSGDQPGWILFCNPASTQGRVRMTLQASKDEGRTWPRALVLYSGPSAYSELAVLEDRSIGVLYEAGLSHAYESVVFARVHLEEIPEVQH